MSETVQIKKEDALKALQQAPKELQPLFTTLFGGLKPLKITERIQTFEDVEAITGKKLTQQDGETTDEFAYRQAKLIAEAYNEGEQLDPMNTNQTKYFPWFKINPSVSGVGLSYSGYAYWYSFSHIGVRLCFSTSANAIDAGKKFTTIYSNFLIK